MVGPRNDRQERLESLTRSSLRGRVALPRGARTSSLSLRLFKIHSPRLFGSWSPSHFFRCLCAGETKAKGPEKIKGSERHNGNELSCREKWFRFGSAEVTNRRTIDSEIQF